MANIINEAHYVMVDVTDNHNKFWNIFQYDDNLVRTQWGRIGTAGCSKDFPHDNSSEAEKFYQQKIHEKEKSGYEKQ